MRLGLGLLASFFIISGTIVYVRTSARIPASPDALSKASIEGDQPAGSHPGGIGFVLNDFHRSLERDGKLVWDIVGKRGQYNALANTAHIDEPRLLVVQENGDQVTLTARQADLALSGTRLSQAVLHDDVVVTFKGETTLKTSQATYSEAEDTVVVPEPLVLSSPMVTVRGKQAVGLIGPQQVTISGGVETVIQPRTKK